MTKARAPHTAEVRYQMPNLNQSESASGGFAHKLGVASHPAPEWIVCRSSESAERNMLSSVQYEKLLQLRRTVKQLREKRESLLQALNCLLYTRH